MGTFYFILVFVSVVAFYAYCNIGLKRDYVIIADAGDLEEATSCKTSYYATHKIIRDKEGRVVNTSETIRIKVIGNGMRPFGIVSGDELLVRKIGKDKNLDSVIRQNDILLIYLSDKRMHKIRAFDHFENGSLMTYRYLDDGKRKNSSKLYSRESVIGKVEFKIKNHYQI